MILLTPGLCARLFANRLEPDADHVPVVRLFNPLGAATWLATEIDENGDTLFGLADLGFGCPELGYFSLSELSSLRLPLAWASSAIPCLQRRSRCRSTRPPRGKLEAS